MKRLTLLLALAASTFAFADEPAGPPPGGPRHGGGPPIERLVQDLGLNTSQTTQVKAILDAQRAKMDVERAQFEASGTRPTREEMQARHQQMDAELQQQLSVVLTPEQLAKFEQLKQRRPKGPPPGDAPPGQGNGSKD